MAVKRRKTKAKEQKLREKEAKRGLVYSRIRKHDERRNSIKTEPKESSWENC